MKARSREINIFSMSALDLFASALGAFILIAVVLFPYFPNTGDSEVRVAEVQAELEREQAEHAATQQALSQCEEDKQACESELQSIKFPHLDIVIALDITGSMRNQITGLRNEVDELAQVLLKLAPSLGLGIVAFGDRYYDTPTSQFDLREIRTNADINELKGFTTTLSPRIGMGGGENNDGPEAIHLALREALNMSWRSTSEKKLIVIVTDNPVYPEEEENTLAMAREFAGREANNGVSTVYVDTGGGVVSHTQAFLSALARAGQGQYVEGGVSMTASVLRSLL